MSKSENLNAKVFFRIYPLEKIQWDYLKIQKDTVYMRNLQQLKDSTRVGPQKFWEFKTDGVFFNNSQEYVYTKVIYDVLDRVIKGENGIIAAFGQTGSGKTVTLGGLQLTVEDFGMIPRIMYDLLKLKKELPRNMKMCIQISYTEFSKSTVADLLKEYPNIIDIYKSREATKMKVTSEYEALKLLYKGEGRKRFNSHGSYLSNLCTSVVTFHITTKNLDYTCPQKITSRLHIIDMAGVDTVGNISSFFKNTNDIGKANIIKTNLEQLILCLMKNIPTQIKLKERMNPLIYYLGSDLSNESILRFIGHIRVLKRDLMITISMLRFGQLVRGLKPKMKEITFEVNEDTQLQYLQNELEKLQKHQVQCSVLLNQDLTNNLNQDRIDHIQRTIKEYLKGRITEINILNVADASAVFKELKEACNRCETDKNRLNEELQFELSSKNKRDSKSSSKSSLKGSKSVGKRISKKSKDSFASLDEKKKREGSSLDHLSAGRMSTSSHNKLPKRASSISGGSQTNKKRSGSFNKRNSLSRKKSFTSTSLSDKKEPRSYLNEVNLMPEIMPEFKEAWDMFVSDPDSCYKTMLEYFLTNANDLQHIYGTYVAQMKLLQSYNQMVQKRKHEVIEAQFVRSFNETVTLSRHSDGETLPSCTEKLCDENLNTAKQNLVEQQEVVLKWQAELKICLSNRRDMKNLLNDSFETYCKDKFHIQVPNLCEEEMLIQEIELDDIVKSVDEDVEEEKKCSMVNKENAIKINRLKKIMDRELRKDMKLKAKKHTTWKNFSIYT